jgi:hypothetical protein
MIDEIVQKFSNWLKRWKSLRSSFRDSAYGTIPARVGPREGVGIRLIPVGKGRDGLETVLGRSNKQRRIRR